MDQGNKNDPVNEALRLLIDASHTQKMDFMPFVGLLYDQFLEGEGDHLKKVREIAASVNKGAHEKPWIYVATAVLSGFIAGLFFRRRE